MKRLSYIPVMLVVGAIFMSAPAVTLAQTEVVAPEIEAIDLLVFGAFGGGYPDRAGLFLATRLRRIPETPLGLEVGLYVPWGIGANIIIDIFRNDYLRVHFLDPGVFYAWTPELRVVRPDVERSVDVTFGAGVEWQFVDSWWLTVDCRFFLPEPVRTISWYGDFSRRVYAQSAAGVQTWLGIGYSF